MADLAIGTVQFGLDYGVSNSLGMPPVGEVEVILNECKRSCINVLDTSPLYGESEKVLGGFDLSGFRVIDKLPPCSRDKVRQKLTDSLQVLQIPRLNGYLIHHFSTFRNDPTIWEEMLKLKSDNLTELIGFSLYSPVELEFLVSNGIEFDLVQVPYNLFDRRFEPYFPELKKQGVTIHTRSAFLQGLFFIPPDKLDPFFMPVKDRLQMLHDWAENENHSISGLCLSFCLSNQYIDNVIFGVNSCNQLKENLSELEAMRSFIFSMSPMTGLLEVQEEAMINPSLWVLEETT